MTYMPIGNNGAQGQREHKEKASRGGSDRTDPLCRVGPLEVGWCHSEHGLLFSHSGGPINGNLVESPAWVEGFGNDAHGGADARGLLFIVQVLLNTLRRDQILLNTPNIAGGSQNLGLGAYFLDPLRCVFTPTL